MACVFDNTLHDVLLRRSLRYGLGWGGVEVVLNGTKKWDNFSFLSFGNFLGGSFEQMECFSLFLYIQNQIRNKIIKALTRSEGHFLELIKPLVSDLDCLLLADNTLSAVPLLGCMVHNLLKILRVKGVEYIEKVLSWWTSTFRINVGEILHKFTVLFEIRPQCLDRDFIIMWHRNVVDLLFLEQLLLLSHDKFEEVLVD